MIKKAKESSENISKAYSGNTFTFLPPILVYQSLNKSVKKGSVKVWNA